MKIAICDDMLQEKILLKEMAERYLEENDYEADIVTFENGEALLKNFETGAYDIIFLDVYMNGMNGLETAKEIRRKDENCFIIFATSTEAFAIDSFDVSAVYYLLKPISSEKLGAAFSKCLKYFNKKQRKLEIISNRKELIFYHKDIYYIETYNHRAIIVTDSEQTSAYVTISELANQLSELPFLRCHRSYIINLEHVEAVQNEDFRLKGGVLVPIGRSYRKQVKEIYKNYLAAAVRNACDLEYIS